MYLLWTQDHYSSEPGHHSGVPLAGTCLVQLAIFASGTVRVVVICHCIVMGAFWVREYACWLDFCCYFFFNFEELCMSGICIWNWTF